MPRDIATAVGLESEWELCDEDRRLNRELYIRWIVTEERNNQIRLAFRTAALLCRLGSGLLLPTEAVIRIVEYMVVTRCQTVLPVVLVCEPIAHVGTSLDYLLLVAEIRFSRATLERAWSLLENERVTLGRCIEYLRNGVISAEHRRVRIERDLLGFARRRIPSELNQWILELHLDVLITE